MTSSFGTIVGRERDKIPGYGIDNYAATEADLTTEVNNQITRNQDDTRRFYDEMAQIQKLLLKLLYETYRLWQLFLSQLAKLYEYISKDRKHKKKSTKQWTS